MDKAALKNLIADLRSQKPLVRVYIPEHENTVRKIKVKPVQDNDGYDPNDCFDQGISIGRTLNNFRKWNAGYPVHYEISKEYWRGRSYIIEYSQHLYYSDKTLYSKCVFYPDGKMKVEKCISIV